MKSLICKLRRRHDWRVWPTDDDRCETCGVFRLYPSGEIVQPVKNDYKVFLYGSAGQGQSSAATMAETSEDEQLDEETAAVRPGPRARPSSLAERAHCSGMSRASGLT